MRYFIVVEVGKIQGELLLLQQWSAGLKGISIKFLPPPPPVNTYPKCKGKNPIDFPSQVPITTGM